ncbi:hypothetical protein BDR05DRAFT_958958 [Suillus weaverae]|nr:hypothetical protein BDR05DRAFT_958958 [Suillus weaverae]
MSLGNPLFTRPPAYFSHEVSRKIMGTEKRIKTLVKILEESDRENIEGRRVDEAEEAGESRRR